MSNDKNKNKTEPRQKSWKTVLRLSDLEVGQDTGWGPFSLLINYCQRMDETKAN